VAVYNPFSTINLCRNISDALFEKEPEPLNGIPQFDGIGMYAIYYTGSFEPYKLMATCNKEFVQWPIYIGKASAGQLRRATYLFSENEKKGTHLWNRLRDHVKSINDASNLNVADFQCRYLELDDIWLLHGEILLIGYFKPVWNLYLEGFGHHDPGAGRYGKHPGYTGLRPMWDVLHPGRKWAYKCNERTETVDFLSNGISSYLESNPPPGKMYLTPTIPRANSLQKFM
jgi:Eco29kI restriction endonuclease